MSFQPSRTRRRLTLVGVAAAATLALGASAAQACLPAEVASRGIVNAQLIKQKPVASAKTLVRQPAAGGYWTPLGR